MALALLTTISMPPKWAAVRSIASLTAPSSRTSTASASARPPAASISAAAVTMMPHTLLSGAIVFAAIAMLAPSRAARSATASPIPREAPVMKRVLPLRDMSHVQPVERSFVLNGLQAVEQRHHPVASEALRQQEELFAQFGPRQRPLWRALEARHLAGHFAAVLELDGDGRHQVAAVLSGRHRHPGPRREVEDRAIMNRLLIERARIDRIAVKRERDAEGNRVLRHHHVGRRRDVVGLGHALIAGDGDGGHIGGGELVLVAQLLRRLDRVVRCDVAGIALEHDIEGEIIGAQPASQL